MHIDQYVIVISIGLLIPRLHDTTGCQTGCTTDLTTGCIHDTAGTIQPVVKRV